MQNIAILGATGSIGASTLDVIARHPSRFRVAALTANRKVDELAELCRRHRPAYACVADATRAPRLRERLAAAGIANVLVAADAGRDPPWYRVRLGPIASVADYDALLARLKALGIDSPKLVTN
ncbi:MAG TPA: SPOR domain-containing protein [Burkholderiales bacterium]|nr:SPOR domain-containing protein [Burkholderiales bacterium]